MTTQRGEPDNTPAILRSYLDGVEQAIDDLLCQADADLSVMQRYHMGWVDQTGRPSSLSQGKRLRPSLCVFACEAVGGAPGQALAAAAAIELLHNFSLIHDDIQDGDLQRHHRPTVWAVYGKGQAVQAGNAMRILSGLGLRRLMEQRGESAVAAACSHALSAACLEMIEGQFLDLDFEGRTDVDTAAYLRMIGLKTGALIRCAMYMGAMAGSGDAATVEALARCGRHIGLVFQIRDDYLGIWGREDETGKPAGSDIRRKKNSLPVVYALEQAGGEDRERIRSVYAKDEVDDADVADVVHVLEGLGAPEHVQGLAAQQAERVEEALDGVRASGRARRELQELVHFLLTRDR